MPIVSINTEGVRDQLLERRKLLHAFSAELNHPNNLASLLDEVDEALDKLAKGTYGICETCHESIETQRILSDPLARNCLDHLSQGEQQSLERDLDLAYVVQRNLLPRRNLKSAGWETAYHYEPSGPVSGDYCDLIVPPDGEGLMYFFVGDVSGKGVAASILMAQLQAIIKSLLRTNQPVAHIAEHANQLFCEATQSDHFATLTGGIARQDGTVEMFNAGHSYPLLIQRGKVSSIPATAVPLGMFCKGEFGSVTHRLSPGDSLILYTDGLTELRNLKDEFFGEDRLMDLLKSDLPPSPHGILHTILASMDEFRSSASKGDDVTIMVLRKT